MRALTEGLTPVTEFEDIVNASREQLRLALAYSEAMDRLARADVVLRAAVSFVENDGGADMVEAVLENLFDSVKVYRASLFPKHSGAAREDA